MTKEDYWEAIVKNPSGSYKQWFESEKIFLRETITKDANVLDMCCGNGRDIDYIIDITKNITGIDHDTDIVNSAKRRFADYPSVKILLAEAQKLPFKDNTFDFVICTATFNNFGENKLKALAEMKRVMKKGGFLIVGVYSEDAFNERTKTYKKIKIPIKSISGTTVHFDKSTGYELSEQFSKEQLIEFLRNAGMNLVEIKKVGIAYLCKASK
jgi:ubiquinone/menaquinone biosynthesis C-methylase UbiE